MSLPRLFRAPHPPNSSLSPTLPFPISEENADSTMLINSLRTEFDHQIENGWLKFCPRFINGAEVPSQYRGARWIQLGYRPTSCKGCKDCKVPFFPSTATFYESRILLDSPLFFNSIVDNFNNSRRNKPAEHLVNNSNFSFIVTSHPRCKRKPSKALNISLLDNVFTPFYPPCEPKCLSYCCICSIELTQIDPHQLTHGDLPTLLTHPRQPGRSFNTHHFLSDDCQVGCVHCASDLHPPFHQLTGSKTESCKFLAQLISPDETNPMSSIFRFNSVSAPNLSVHILQDLDVGFNYLSGLDQAIRGEIRMLLPVPNFDEHSYPGVPDPKPDTPHHQTDSADCVSSFCEGPFYGSDLIYRSVGVKYTLLEISRFMLPGPPDCFNNFSSCAFHHTRDILQIYFFDELTRLVFNSDTTRTNFSPSTYAAADLVLSNTLVISLREVIRQFLADSLGSDGNGHPWTHDFIGIASIFEVKQVVVHRVLNFLHDYFVDSSAFPPYLRTVNSQPVVQNLLNSYITLFADLFETEPGEEIPPVLQQSPSKFDISNLLPSINDDFSSPLQRLFCENDRVASALPTSNTTSSFDYKTAVLSGVGPAGTTEWQFQRVLICRYLRNVVLHLPPFINLPAVRPWNRYATTPLFGAFGTTDISHGPLSRQDRVARGYSGLCSNISFNSHFGPRVPFIGKFRKHATLPDQPDPEMMLLLPSYFETGSIITKASATARKPSALFRDGLNSHNHTAVTSDQNFFTFLNFYLYRLHGGSRVSAIGDSYCPRPVFSSKIPCDPLPSIQEITTT